MIVDLLAVLKLKIMLFVRQLTDEFCLETILSLKTLVSAGD